MHFAAVPLAYRALNNFSRSSKMVRFCIIDLHINPDENEKPVEIRLQMQFAAVPLAYRALNNFSRSSKMVRFCIIEVVFLLGQMVF
jgi:hypothetical protein